MTRKRYTKEFKQDAVRLVTEHGYTQAEAGRNLGINPKMLGRWIQEFRADENEAFRGNGKRTAEQEELRRLRDENRRLKQERDILVKAARPRRNRSTTSLIDVTTPAMAGNHSVPPNVR